MNRRSLEFRKSLVSNLTCLTSDPNRAIWLIAVAFLVFELFLILMHVVVRSLAPVAGAHTDDGTIGGFDLGDEATLAVWFSSFQLLLLSLVSLGLSWIDRSTVAVSSRVRLWKAAAIMFLVMSIDETAGLHEVFGKGMAFVFSDLPVTDRHWGMLPYAIAITLLASCIAMRLRRQAAYLVGVIAGWTIWVGGQLVDQRGSAAPSVNLVIEEGLEMFGGTVLLLTLSLLLLRLYHATSLEDAAINAAIQRTQPDATG